MIHLTRPLAILVSFLGLVWRESPSGGRVSPRAAWRIAVFFHTECPRRQEARDASL